LTKTPLLWWSIENKSEMIKKAAGKNDIMMSISKDVVASYIK